MRGVLALLMGAVFLSTVPPAAAGPLDSVEPSSESTTVDTAASTSANLSVSQLDAPDPATAGAHVVYTATVRNHGPLGTTGVVLTDTLPTGVTFSSATPSKGRCSPPNGAGVFTCRLGQLLKGRSATVAVNLVPTGAGTITNEATVTGAQPDAKPANNHSVESTLVTVTTADLSLAMTDAPDPVSVGQPLTYSLDIRNAGPDKATTVKLTDQLPGDAVFVSATPTQGSCNGPNAGGTLTCPLGQIAPGAGVQVTIVVSPTTNGTLTNHASVEAAEIEPTPPNNDASAATTVSGVACTITGTSGDDTLTGTNGDDVICGLGGADTIAGSNGNDRLDGGLGPDELKGNEGFDQLFGRAGDDALGGGPGFDLARFDSSALAVVVSLANGTATGEGTDSLAEIDGIIGSANADALTGDQDDNEIYGRGGADQISGGNGFDYARYDFAPSGVQVDLPSGTAAGAEGADTLAGIDGVIGSNFADQLQGNDKDNRLAGRGGDDDIRGGTGKDFASYDFAPAAVQVDLGAATAAGGDGSDTLAGIEGILGSTFADVLTGDSSPNPISGRAGDDDIVAGDGRDDLFGEAGRDSIQGQRGDDFLDGGPSDDRLDGGADSDRCIATGGDRTISCESIGSASARTSIPGA